MRLQNKVGLSSDPTLSILFSGKYKNVCAQTEKFDIMPWKISQTEQSVDKTEGNFEDKLHVTLGQTFPETQMYEHNRKKWFCFYQVLDNNDLIQFL